MTRRWTESELADIRNRPLEPLAQALGYRRDPRDRQRWKREGSIISINGMRFYDHLCERGGGGAIDLVIHARRCSFADAVAFLAGPEDPRKLRLPPPCEAAWPAVRGHLANQRTIPPALLDACRRRQLLHADRRSNAVFRCTDNSRKTTGAEVAGTGSSRYRAMAPGSQKSAGSFWIPTGKNPPHTAVLVESAVDALSLRALGTHCQPGTVIVSTTGATARLPAWLKAWNIERILCAFDADEAGDRCAARLAKADRRVTRLRPQNAKDWNDILKARRQEHETQNSKTG